LREFKEGLASVVEGLFYGDVVALLDNVALDLVPIEALRFSPVESEEEFSLQLYLLVLSYGHQLFLQLECLGLVEIEFLIGLIRVDLRILDVL